MSIHSSAIISPSAKVGKDVHIGPFSIVHDNVVLGDRVTIGAYCELGVTTPLGDGAPLIIGDDSLIRSYSVFYESCSLGDNLMTGHRVTVRENTTIGKGVQLGSSSEIQGDCQIGDYVRFQSNIFVGKKTVIGNFVWALPYVVFTNDPTPPSNVLDGCIVGDFSSIAASAVILPGVELGCHSVVAAKACVTKDVAPNMLVAGIPARVIGEASDVKLRDGSDSSAYPWIEHFTRGYPQSIVEEWKKNSGVKNDS